jgi:hypothetical protein
MAPEAELKTFEPHDPDEAGCLIEIAEANWATPAQSEGQA